jgi:hypothetical protein
MVEYAGENKARLGAAGVGTFGFILGTALAGPLGGVAGGVLVSAVTGKTITTLESFGEMQRVMRLQYLSTAAMTVHAYRLREKSLKSNWRLTLLH